MKGTTWNSFLAFAIFTLLLTVKSGCMSYSTPVPSEPGTTPDPQPTSTSPEPVSSDISQTIVELEKQVGFPVREPASILSRDYLLESATLDEATQSVCLQYRHAAESGDSVLLVAQGPRASAPPLELIPGWPEYAVKSESIGIGGATNSLHTSGWRRGDWACTEIAAREETAFSYALAPRLTWEADGQQFDLYSVSEGCGTPAGLTTLDLLRVAEELTGNSTHPVSELDPECLSSTADAGKIAGFDVKEPAYLPQDVSFYFATYERVPSQSVTLLFLHEQHRNMGRFFQITQSKEATPAFAGSCAETPDHACEVLQIGNRSVVYQTIGVTEQLDWQADGFFFSLFRSAGEPGKVYKDEMLKVVESMK